MSFGFNECRVPYNQMMLMTLALCCLVVLLIIVQSGELQSAQPKPLVKWASHLDKVYFYQTDAKNWTYIVNERFLSFSIDSSEIYHGFRNPTLTNKALIRLISHLGGGYLRLGGTTADRVVFTPAARAWPHDYLPVDSGLCGHININCPNTSHQSGKNIKHVSMSADDWTEVNDFCRATGLKLLFDLNVLLRSNNSNNSWDPRNAELLLDYSFSQGYLVDWELGNEPNTFEGVFGVEVAPGKLAIDYTVLRQLLYRYSLYKDSKLVGPSTTSPKLKKKKDRPLEYIKTFLAHGADVDAISWHFYYTGPNVTAEDYLDPANYDNLRDTIDVVKEAVKEAGASVNTPIWLGEVGSSYGGGAVNLSNRFIASLLYLNTLGTSAAHGISLVIRQSLYRGKYKLINPETMTPNSDFWVSVVYKRLVGRKVLNINEMVGVSLVNRSNTVPLRMFAHCSTTPPYPVIFGINLNNETLGISLFSNNTGHLFSLSGYPYLTSRQVEMNGEVLELGTDQSLPKFTPITVDLREPVPVRPYSLFFLVSYNNLTICE